MFLFLAKLLKKRHFGDFVVDFGGTFCYVITVADKRFTRDICYKPCLPGCSGGQHTLVLRRQLRDYIYKLFNALAHRGGCFFIFFDLWTRNAPPPVCIIDYRGRLVNFFLAFLKKILTIRLSCAILRSVGIMLHKKKQTERGEKY